jgi:hypothetical protein
VEAVAENTKYMLMSRHQNAQRNHDIRLANVFFENVAKLKCNKPKSDSRVN